MGCHFFLQGIFPVQGLNPVSCIADTRFTIWATREAQYVTQIPNLGYTDMFIYIIIDKN